MRIILSKVAPDNRPQGEKTKYTLECVNGSYFLNIGMNVDLHEIRSLAYGLERFLDNIEETKLIDLTREGE